MEHLGEKGCVLVDTTCGSVLNVWKMVHRYARDGYTVVIHGKHYHEETRATASQALTHPGGHYLCVRDTREAEVVCEFLRGTVSSADVLARFGGAASSPGFDPARDLERIGLANQTTMLMTREPGDPGDAARGDARPPRRRRGSSVVSAPSTPSVPRPRIARTRSSPCSTPTTST